MCEAAEEEAKMVIEADGVDNEGHPMITVVANGAWSKCSYKTKYNSLSGLGSTIGYRIKKVLFIGMRNKYCTVSVHSSATDAKNTVASHKCAKNWSGSSASMEQDVIVEGMLQSIGMHGLVYRKFMLSPTGQQELVWVISINGARCNC
ncbi:hypothetical protein PR048_016551 [Dryococelus australis]|uniref:Mutator-like transposase domain-containing protein n=1 Tax=Dryococelus australis TaxID=614101 RepID=A0ABQ9HLB0_9NEOP|nr:hypothetical protein PR048_016551 [Dryococelus australis]